MPDFLVPPTSNETSVATLVFFLVVFGVVGAFFLFIHLVMGSVIRPNKPEPEKLTIYECGEPTVGSAWVQFDLRYYVVALLFVIFDVEVAFFFPWATVFGKANELASLPTAAEMRDKEFSDAAKANVEKRRQELSNELRPSGAHDVRNEFSRVNPQTKELEAIPIRPDDAWNWANIAFFDILVFFGVLMVGFAYLWKRGDLDWVRSTAAERAASRGAERALPPAEPEALVGAASGRM